MGKIIFEVRKKENFSLPELIKAVSKMRCQLNVCLETKDDTNVIELSEIDDESIDSSFELISKFYTILHTQIDTTDDSNLNAEKETTIVAAAHATEAKPYAFKEVIFEKVEFENEYIRTLVNKLLNTVFSIMLKKDVPEKEIGAYIQAATTNIYLNYWGKEFEEFSIGDVVQCNLGALLPGEVSGSYVAGIVCDFLPPNMVYIVPLAKSVSSKVSNVRSLLTISSPKDVTYTTADYKEGTVLLDKGRYIRAERVRRVVGETKPEFLEKVFKKLSNNFDFTKYLEYPMVSSDVLGHSVKIEEMADSMNTVISRSVYECEIVKDEEKNSSDIASAERSSDSFDNANTDMPKETSTEENSEAHLENKIIQKRESEEKVILGVIGTSLEKLGVDELTADKVEDFLCDIGMMTSTFVKQAILYACGAKKITYAGVLAELCLKNGSNVSEAVIKTTLKDTFKKWVADTPEVSEKYPRLSFVSFLKIFSKKFAKEENESKKLTNQ